MVAPSVPTAAYHKYPQALLSAGQARPRSFVVATQPRTLSPSTPFYHPARDEPTPTVATSIGNRAALIAWQRPEVCRSVRFGSGSSAAVFKA
jgi:hypothetical protein